MLEIEIPGCGALRLAHLVLDYNGTIALDGELIAGVEKRIAALAEKVSVHVITADTFGGVRERISALPVTLHILSPGRQDEAKLAYVETLGAGECACVGNGRNDRLMLKEAALGIAVVEREGAAAEAMLAADAAVRDIVSGLDLLLNPLRLKATLRL